MDNFRYDRLDLDQLSFRLVRLQMGRWDQIECEIIHATLDNNVIPYEAVSYRWGSPMKTDSICIQGRNMNVTSNLYHILQDLRYPDEDRYLWVDAICINQDDVSERGHQVGQMKYIYSRAERVIFFVGQATKYTDLLLAALMGLQNGTRGNDWSREDQRWDEVWNATEGNNQSSPTLTLFREALTYITNQSWFYRVWILQEVGNARSGIVQCGKASVSARVFAVAPRLLGVYLDSHAQAVFDLMPGPSRQLSALDRDFYSLLQKFSGAQAQDERDNVYALIGMCSSSIWNGFVPNYAKSVAEVIRDTIFHIWGYDIRRLLKAPFATMAQFLKSLDELDTLVFIWSIKSGDIMHIRYHISNRGDHINVTKDTIAAIIENELLQEEIVEAFIRKRKSRAAIIVGSKNLLDWMKLEGFNNMCGRFFFGETHKINDRSGNFQTPLLVASKYGHVDAIKFLLRHGAYIEQRDGNGNTPLLLASRQGDAESVRALLCGGANIEALDNDGNTPLLLASTRGDMETIRLLMSCGATLKETHTYKNILYLFDLIQKQGKASLVWLSWGSYVGARDAYERAPLISEIKHGRLEAFRWFFKHYSDNKIMVMTKDTYLGKILLMIAAGSDSFEIFRLLTRTNLV